MNLQFFFAATIALISAVGLAPFGKPMALPQLPSVVASLDTAMMKQAVRHLLELDRASDQVRNHRDVYVADEDYPIAFGDLDGDNDPDAAALVVWEYGGSGWEQRLYILRNNGGEKWKLVTWTCIGRKLQPETVAAEVVISNGRVILKGNKSGDKKYSIQQESLRQE